MNIAVVGTGYVGLVTGTCFSEMGNHVICVDIDADKVERMRNGVIPIYEPHLDILFERNIRQDFCSVGHDYFYRYHVAGSNNHVNYRSS